VTAIPKPTDIPDLDTPLTSKELRIVLEALDPRIPWTPDDRKNGRKVGGFLARNLGGRMSFRSDDDGDESEVEAAKARFKWLETLGWVITFRSEPMGGGTSVYANKPPKE
jgi:hypothetical protein